ncbi:MAG: hypothetical protein V9G24_14175 [Rhodoblastus sp.]
MGDAVLVPGRDAGLVLLDTFDARRRLERDAAGFLRAFQQRGMDVDAVDDGVRIVEALAEGLARRDAADERPVDGVVHDHFIDIDGAAARLLADAERVEGGEGVGTELDAGADFADLRRLFENRDLEALPRQRQRRGEPADAAADHDDPAALPSHVALPAGLSFLADM